ncbi:hypothetical protein G9A89_022632 [Geosiphon pyriformis]|nr:hypothetical protein G9A89_022632 [Geosiphon pyriformis]
MTGAFVDDTIWIGNSQTATQFILDIANKFFSINNISINNNKIIAILINRRVKNTALRISGSLILIAKCASVVMFANAFGIFDQLFEYRFLDLQVFLENGIFMVNNLPCAFFCPGRFSVSSVLESFFYYDQVSSLKKFGVAFCDRLLNKCGIALVLKYVSFSCLVVQQIQSGDRLRHHNLRNILHYSNTESENISAEACATYFKELDYNIIQFCKEKYPSNAQFAFELEFETETSSNKRQKNNRPVHTTPNTPKISFKHLQTPEQRTKDFTSLRSPTRQQEPLQTNSNLLDFLAENQSEHSETVANKENNSEITKEKSIDDENGEDEMTTYIAKIPEFNGEDIKTSPQEWLDQVTKAGDANGWNAARMLRTIPYFLKGTAGEWFENLTNDYYSDAQILDQFITGLKDKLIKKVHLHVPEDLNSAIQHAKRYKIAIEEANHTKLVNLAIGETSLAAEEKIDQLTKKVENYFTNQQQQQPQRYQPPQRRNQNNFAPLSNNQPQNCHYCGISGHWKRDCRKLQRDQQNRSNQCYSPPQQSYYQLSPPAYYSPKPQYQNNYYQPAPQPIQQQYQQPPTQHYQVPA